jgi:hypothetical protein
MAHRIPGVALALFASAALAQTPSPATNVTSAASSTSPVAFVYVTRPTHIDGFAVSSSGKLTPVPGSPFANTNVKILSITKKFLFGESGDDKTITSYSINSKGTLKKVATRTEHPLCLLQDRYPDMQVDFTRSNLYYFQGPDGCANPPGTGTYLSYRIESDGTLQFLGDSGGTTADQIDDFTQENTAFLKMAGTNKYAYDSYCAEDNFNLSVIDIYKRESSGRLQYFSQSNDVPAPGSSGKPYCAGILATDSENHLAVALQRVDSQGGDTGFLIGPYFLASYTADSNGKLTTKSTAENMPEATFVGDFAPTAISIDPTNKFLALGAGEGGALGFAIYHFNGSNPITKYSSVLQPKVGFGDHAFAWDKSHHLFVLGGGNLYVYTVTSTSIKQAAGSPYSIPESSSVSVLDLP